MGFPTTPSGVSGDVSGREGLLEGAAQGPLAEGIQVPTLWALREFVDLDARPRAVSGLPLPVLGDRRDGLPPDPAFAADVVLGHLLRGPPQEGDLGAPAAARYGDRELRDGLDPTPQAAFGTAPPPPRTGWLASWKPTRATWADLTGVGGAVARC
jgi:hypothetical protein